MADSSTAIIVAENGKGRYQQSVSARQHALLADEPASAGGEDAGLNPFEFLCAGLGACTSMTLRMYAERKQLPLEGVSVSVSHQRTSKEGQNVTIFDRQISLTGPLTVEQRQRMLEIANKCPVHRALEGTIEIRSMLREA